MADSSKTKIYGVLLLAGLALGLWWWMSGDDDQDAKGSDKAAATAKAGDAAAGGGLAPKALRRSDIDPFKAAKAGIAGTVRDEAGQPIAGAQVCARVEDRDLAGTDRRPPDCTVTRDDGTYRLGELLGAEHRLFASAKGYIPTRYESRTGIQQTLSTRVDLLAGNTREGIDFVLKEGGVEVAGVVKDIAGGVVDGAYVSTGGSWWRGVGGSFTRSDEEGRFSLWVAGPEVDVKAFADGYATGSREVAVPGTFVELFLTPESVIEGKLVWAGTNKPVADAKVSARQWRGASTYSDANGVFRLDGLNPGSYKVRVSGPELTGRSDKRVHVGMGETSETIIIEVHGAVSVRGQVFVDDETPCSFATVRLAEPKSEGNRSYRSGAEEDGSILVSGVLPGTYEVTVTCEGYLGEEEYEDIVIADASVDGLRWSVHEARAIRGRVIDDKGEPVKGARVSANMKADENDPRGRRVNAYGARSDGKGNYEIAGLLPGKYEVGASHDDYPRRDDPIEASVEAGVDTSDIEIELPTGGNVEGTVRDQNGAPVAQVNVFLQGPRWGGGVQTNDEGAFVIENAAAGDYRIQARRGWSEKMRAPGASDDDQAGERIQIAAGETTTVDLVVESQNGRITGRVVDESGEPVIDAFVHASRQSDSVAASKQGGRGMARWGNWNEKPILTDEDGRFELEHLAAEGTYIVVANRKGGGRGMTEDVAVGTDVEVSIAETGEINGIVKLEGGGFPESFRVQVSDRTKGNYASDDFFRTDGKLQFDNLAPGTYEVQANSDEGNAKVTVELTAEAGVATAEIVLKPRVKLIGQLVDAETGEPVSGLRVTASAGGFSFGGMRDTKGDQKDISDEQGRFEVENAATGKVTVMVMAPSFNDSDYGWTWMARRIPTEPREQDIGKVELVKKRLDSGKEAGDLGFKRKALDPDIEPEEARNIVAFVRPGGPASKVGLAVGDEIIEIDGMNVTALNSGRYDKLLRVPPGTTLKLGLTGGKTLTLTSGPPV
ncbi:MAG: carboxypeptidase regulatory-like domain-containing protein [Myxococcota bacterium]